MKPEPGARSPEPGAWSLEPGARSPEPDNERANAREHSMPDYALMNQLLYEGKAKEVEQLTKDALAEGRSAQEILQDGLIAGMSVVGEDFKHNVLYVPEVLIAARAMKAGMAVLKPLLSAREGGTKPSGVLLMGTVRGDLHDIGKNLVLMMAEGAGFEVHDIGVDQSVEKFLAAADRCKPDIVGMSALLTTTMTYMKTVIEGFESAGQGHVKMAVGGAPISQMFADEIGADGYGANASAAVDLFLRLVGR
jgi:5-methyltetrahydrofolate--homocysteine methyltransferase